MRAAIFHGIEDIRIGQVPDPRIEKPTDAIVRITRTAICGSDLWFYRGQQEYEPGSRTGHEPMGLVEEVGSEVRTVKPGDLVLAPFAISDGTCEFCEAGLHTSCTHGGFWSGITDEDIAEVATRKSMSLAENLKALSMKALTMNAPYSDNTTGTALLWLGD